MTLAMFPQMPDMRFIVFFRQHTANIISVYIRMYQINLFKIYSCSGMINSSFVCDIIS